MTEENNPIGVILVHPASGGYTAFDFLVREDKAKEYEWLKEEGYQVDDCPFVEKWLEKHPNYKYMASEDLAHIPCFNRAVIALLEKLHDEGFEEEYVEE